jgi:hypothetical protein
LELSFKEKIFYESLNQTYSKNIEMKKMYFIILLSFLFSIYAQEPKDVVYLKNGSVIRGILQETSDEKIKIETSEGNVFVFSMDEVEKILKENSDAADLQSPSDGVAMVKNEYETYNCTDKKYTVDLPKGWETGYSKNSLVSALMAVDQNNPGNRLSITTGSTTAMSLKEAYNLTKKEFRKQFDVEDEGNAMINGMEAMWFTYSFSSEGKRTKCKIYILKKGKRQYSVQAILPEDQFDMLIPQMDEIIFTFKTY